jgi:hypothetical protein
MCTKLKQSVISGADAASAVIFQVLSSMLQVSSFVAVRKVLGRLEKFSC